MQNRKIKFRCWDKENHEWIYFPKEMFEENYETFLCLNVPDENFQLNQFIGLKDKDGKEIYEGDIVKFKTTISEGITEIIWREDVCCFTSPKHGSHIMDNETTFEVIGNIYENAGLLAVAP